MIVWASGRNTPENGQAALAFKVDRRNDFIFSARLALPRVLANRGQYGIWIMVAELKGTFEQPAMVQSGLFRWQPNNFALQPFVAVEHSGGRINTQLLTPVPEGSSEGHDVQISRRADAIYVKFDGNQIFHGSWSAFFKDANHLYLKIAAEVSDDGDMVTGTVRNIELVTSGKTIAPDMPARADSDRGVTFVCRDHAFVATGSFDSKQLFDPKWFRAPPCEEK